MIKTLGYAEEITLSAEEFRLIGKRIFENECSGNFEALTSWNEGENFASLGIGHFIWYPEGKRGPFDESFREFLLFLKGKGAALPLWLENRSSRSCPWRTRQDFLNNLQSREMVELRVFLKKAIYLQTLFIVERQKKALGQMLAVVEKDNKGQVKKQFYRLASKAMGMYALIDYVNFKGEGILKTERYKGEGWGLLQVLLKMDERRSKQDVLKEFVRSAEAVLSRRVKNSPLKRKEERWLPGWRKRIKTYLDENLYLKNGV